MYKGVCIILNHFILKKFRHTERLQEYYNELLYTLHLDSPSFISFYILSHTHTHSIHVLLIFIIPFRNKLQNIWPLILKYFSIYFLGRLYHSKQSPFNSYYDEPFGAHLTWYPHDKWQRWPLQIPTALPGNRPLHCSAEWLSYMRTQCDGRTQGRRYRPQGVFGAVLPWAGRRDERWQRHWPLLWR